MAVVERSPATGLSYDTADADRTEYYCRKCKCLKFRCPGCKKILCLCEKRNNHIVGDLIFCLPSE